MQENKRANIRKNYKQITELKKIDIKMIQQSKTSMELRADSLEKKFYCVNH